MRARDILNLPSIPLSSPSYPRGPYRFINREYFIITYESDPQAIADALPEPLEPAGENLVLYEFIRMADSSGFGDYTESGAVIPARYRDQPVSFTAMMYLDCEPPISGGREIWGFPKKYGEPKLRIAHDTLTGTLEYAGQLVAIGTMVYKHHRLFARDVGPADPNYASVVALLTKTQVNLKLIPNVDGTAGIAQLVAYNLTEVTVHGAWDGPARLHLVPHVNAPVADLPVRRVISGTHLVADLTLPFGRVLHDYLRHAPPRGIE